MFTSLLDMTTKQKLVNGDPTQLSRANTANPYKLPHALLRLLLHGLLLLLRHTPTSYLLARPLLRRAAVAHDVQQQRVGRQVHTVVGSRDRRGDVLRRLRLTARRGPHVDATQLDEAGVVLHGLADQARGSGLSLGADDRRLLVLLRLLHHVLRALCLLLRCDSPVLMIAYPPASPRRRW